MAACAIPLGQVQVPTIEGSAAVTPVPSMVREKQSYISTGVSTARIVQSIRYSKKASFVSPSRTLALTTIHESSTQATQLATRAK